MDVELVPLEHRRINLANWESRVDIHVKSTTYDVAGLVAGTRRLSDVVAFDEPFLGDLTGLDVVHLQCHIGTDTLSLARLGAPRIPIAYAPTMEAEARVSDERIAAKLRRMMEPAAVS